MKDLNRTQGVRLVFLIIYLAILLVINYITFGDWIPQTGSKGLWFYTGAASLILGNLLITPFYTKPVDALSYAFLATTGLYLVNDFKSWTSFESLVFWLVMGFLGLIIILSLLAISLKDSNKDSLQKMAKTCMILTDILGNQKVVFSTVFIFSMVVFHSGSPREVIILSMTWILLVITEPDKHVWNISRRIWSIWHSSQKLREIGIIAAYQVPRIILIRQNEKAKTEFGTILTYKDSHDIDKIGIVLNYVGRDEFLSSTPFIQK